MAASETSGTRSLLEQSAWLQRLARSLVADPGRAADAVQDALLIAHRSGEREPTRRWLATVLRRVVLQEHRSRRRRADHEARSARADVDEHSAAATVERLDTQRRVLEAVRSLDEPYRTTLTLRFLEDLPPREVARRMGVPVKTVHTRLERGLARLRVRLDASCGGRQAWLPAFVLLARGGPPAGAVGASAATTGVLLMGTTAKVTAATAALVIVGFLVQRTLDPGGGAAHATPADALPSLREGSAEEVRPPAAPPEREGRAAAVGLPPVDVPEESLEEVAPRATFRGIVLDIDERPVAAVPVRFEPTTWVEQPLPEEERSARSDSRGEFELPLLPYRGRLVAPGPDLVSVVSPGVAGTEPPEPPVVVVAPARRFAGHVLDRDGLPVGEASLSVWLPAEVAERFRPGGLAGVVALVRAQADAQGAFDLGQVGFVAGTRLRCEAAGFEPTELELPPDSRADLLIELDRMDRGEDTWAGIVVDRAGTPVAGAYVSLGTTTTRSDSTGSFGLKAEATEGAGTIRAVAPGWQPVEVELADVPASGRSDLVLRLIDLPRSIAGRVEDPAGGPVADALVWSFDVERFGQVTERVGELDVLVSTDVEALMAGRRGRGLEARTDEQGRFELLGLLERPYSLLALHPATLEVVRAAAVPAGSEGVTLRFDGTDPCRRVAGRVTTRAGAPVPGAFVRAAREVLLPDGTRRWRSADMDFGAESDEHGRFVFEALATEGTRLILNGEGVPAAQTVDLGSVGDLEAIRFVVPQRCHVRVILATDPLLADAFELRDASDVPLNLSFMRGSITLGVMSVGIEDGESALTQADDSARVLVLFKQGVEVQRVPVDLRADAVNELRL